MIIRISPNVSDQVEIGNPTLVLVLCMGVCLVSSLNCTQFVVCGRDMHGFLFSNALLLV